MSEQDKCVLCGKGKKLTSTAEGRAKIRSVAEQKNDHVWDKIKSLDSDVLFYYHSTNLCYKNYTHKTKVLKEIKKRDENKSDAETADVQQSTSTSADARPSCSVDRRFTRSQLQVGSASGSAPANPIKNVCTICNLHSCKSDTSLVRISETARAENFLEITRFFKDEVFTRTCTLNDAHAVFAADLFYHRNCLRKYELKYEQAISRDQSTSEVENTSSDFDSFAIDYKLISQIVDSITSQINAGEIFTLSNVRDRVNALSNNVKVDNKSVKRYLISKFGDSIEFSISSNKNKPTLFYHSNVSLDDVIERLQQDNILKESGRIIKKALNNVNFNLEDKFFDENNLKNSWNQIKIPEEVLTFYSTLYSFSKKDFDKKENFSGPKQDEKPMQKKKLKILSLYQIMVYILKNGAMKTPLHVMNGLQVHFTCRSKGLIEIFNHAGLSISYDEVLRAKTSLSLYTLQTFMNNTPLPSHFDKKKFTIGAFDNFDHNECTPSGLGSSHDTSTVIFQDDSDEIFEKPNISSTEVNKYKRSLDKNLCCQTLKNCFKPNEKIIISEEATIDISVSPDEYEIITNEDMAYFLARMNTLKSSHDTSTGKYQLIPTWSAFHSVVCNDNRSTQTVAFFPLLPYKVTRYDTVFTAMYNIVDVHKQLDQKYFPLFCDEGVYCIAKHIQLLYPELFKYIVLMMGSFHMVKVVLFCIGKYLNESGIDYIFIELGIFGANVVEQVLSGHHYNRSLRGIFMFGEALMRLLLEAFLEEIDASTYDEDLAIISDLQSTFCEESYDESKSLYEVFERCSSRFVKDFKDFVKRRSKVSQFFKYGNNLLILMQLLRNMIRADRIGDWKLHVDTVRKLLPIFRILDRINYLRWCSMYIRDIMNLFQTKPELYEQFMKGKFVVKRSNVPFTSVGTDQALEQTINKVQKNRKQGIIGYTKNKEAVTSWNLNFHEVLAVCNFHRDVMMVKLENDELHVHHNFSETYTINYEDQIVKIISFLRQHGNPFEKGQQPLKNFVTQEIPTPETTQALLNIFETGCNLYNDFYKERFIDKSKSISDTISKYNLPNFRTIQGEKNNTKTVSSKKQNIIAYKLLEIAKERNYSEHRFFSFELVTSNLLFNDDGTLTKEKKKYLLLNELKTLSQIEVEKPKKEEKFNALDFTLIVDVMVYCRQLNWANMVTFNDFAKGFCNMIKNSSEGFTRIDFVFDSYIENSIKLGERQTRYNSCGIDLPDIKSTGFLPKDSSLFWGSGKNKTLLQDFLRSFIFEHCEEFWPGVKIICSATNTMPCQSNVPLDLANLEFLQNREIEEADSRIILHAYQASSVGEKKLLVLSIDTDVVILLLHYWPRFEEKNVQELWIRVGTGQSRGFLPLHLLSKIIGYELCSVLPAVHHLTGADYTSKVGTKHAALQADPAVFLQKFAHDITENGIEYSCNNAEQYLARVLKKTTISTTFDELRYEQYKFDSKTIMDLPPTTDSIRLHILRAFYVTYEQINLLNKNRIQLDPEDFGFELHENFLMPRKICYLYPPVDELVPNCNCTKCVTKHCICKASGLPCISFCNCGKTSSCENPSNI